MIPIVDYLVARDGPPEPSGAAYDYVLAGDGLYLAAQSRFITVRVPVARFRVRGLPALGASVVLRYGRIPIALWRSVLATCRRLAVLEREVLLTVVVTSDGSYVLRVPTQLVDYGALAYRPSSDVVFEIHSHHRLPARFSPTDDRDEQGLRLYGVVGRLDGDIPEIALRVGAHGQFLAVPFGAVFAGEPIGIRDLNDMTDSYEPAGEMTVDGDCPRRVRAIGSMMEEGDDLPD
jgi:PRTRC genetic system protein A